MNVSGKINGEQKNENDEKSQKNKSSAPHSGAECFCFIYTETFFQVNRHHVLLLLYVLLMQRP
jgi:hypothetical protein